VCGWKELIFFGTEGIIKYEFVPPKHSTKHSTFMFQNIYDSGFMATASQKYIFPHSTFGDRLFAEKANIIVGTTTILPSLDAICLFPVAKIKMGPV
jgi:hypothetical protein